MNLLIVFLQKMFLIIYQHIIILLFIIYLIQFIYYQSIIKNIGCINRPNVIDYTFIAFMFIFVSFFCT